MGQGGIPTVGLISGGSITAIRLDHVWVEAFIDYIPSRGAARVAWDAQGVPSTASPRPAEPPRSRGSTNSSVSRRVKVVAPARSR